MPNLMGSLKFYDTGIGPFLQSSTGNRHYSGTVDTGSIRIKVAYGVKRVQFPYLGNDSDGR